jgi:hypothetical protein
MGVRSVARRAVFVTSQNDDEASRQFYMMRFLELSIPFVQGDFAIRSGIRIVKHGDDFLEQIDQLQSVLLAWT